jgi:hypothetical protein
MPKTRLVPGISLGGAAVGTGIFRMATTVCTCPATTGFACGHNLKLHHAEGILYRTMVWEPQPPACSRPTGRINVQRLFAMTQPAVFLREKHVGRIY